MKLKKTVTGSIQEKNGKWYMVINLYDENGRRKLKWISTDLPIVGNKKKAKQMLNEKLSEYNRMSVPVSSLTVSDYFSHWLEVVKCEVRPNTYRSYCGNMKNHIIPYFDKHPILLQELTPSDLEDYYKSKLEKGSKLKVEKCETVSSTESLSTTTILHHHQNISRALSDAVRKGLLISNPASSARKPKTVQYKPTFLNSTQIKSLIAFAHGSTIELPVYLTAVYGFRRSEVLGLKWTNIDFEKKTITISETLQQNTGGNYTATTKTESSYRTLPMASSTYDRLMQQRKRQEANRNVQGDMYIVSDYVCTLDNGQVITPNYLSKKFAKLIRNSDLPNIRLHDLRHSVATNLINGGMSVVEVANWLGHESPTTTLKFYAHSESISKIRIADALTEMLSE